MHIKSCFYVLNVIAAGVLSASCNNTFNTGVPQPSAAHAPVVLQPLRFGKPKKILWADVKAMPARPAVTKLAWDKLPEQPEDTTGYRPFKYPVLETKFDYNTLPEKNLDIDKLPSYPLKFKTYALSPPTLVKGVKPQLKNGNLYLVGNDQDQAALGRAVTRLMYDKDGFLWIACSDGVYRYDGENLLMFLSFPDEEEDFGMTQDSSGNIWLPHPGGQLMILEPKAGILKKSVPHEYADSLQHLMLDGQQRMWATCQSDEVKIIDTKTQTIKILNKKNGLFPAIRTSGIAEDKKGKIWISTGGGGMNILDLERKTIKHLDRAHGLKSDRLNNIVFDSDGRLWTGMYGGMVQVIDPHTQSVQTISEVQSAATGVFVSCLDEDNKGRVWIGTTGGGVTAIDLKKRLAMHLNKDRGLASNGVYDIAQDRKQQVWIAGSAGLNMLGNQNAIEAHKSDSLVMNMMEDGRGLVWLGTEHGVDILDRNKKTSRHLGVKQGLTNDAIHFFEERDKEIFINTDSSLDVLDTAKKIITHFKSSYGNILFDKAGRVCYLDEAGAGINLYDPKAGTLKHFGREALQFNGFIYFMCVDQLGRIWFSDAFGQVRIIDPDAGTIQLLLNIKRDKSNGSVFFLPDDKGNIWMGSARGIYIANLKHKAFINFSAPQGLIDNKVLSMVQHGRSIYAGTNYGVTVITPPVEIAGGKKNWQAVSFAFNRRRVNNYNADLVTNDGIYWLGDVGITAFNLSKKDTSKPIPYINGISVYDHPMYFFNKTVLNRSATDTLWRQNGESWFLKDETPVNTSYAFQSGLKWDNVTGPGAMPVNLQIPYDQNFIRFHFGNLDLIPHDTVRYRYLLDGIDKKWSEITSDTSSVNYMNLQPGNYTFEVTAKNAGGVWGFPAKFSFTINPPWWKTWWAYIIYAALAVCAIWLIVRYRSNQLEKEKRVLENKVRLATEEITHQNEEIAAQRDSLETQRNDLEKTLDELKATQTQLVQREKMASLGELTAGIAHEIQNPLNFVNNFSEVSAELVDEMDEELDKGDIAEAKAIASDIKQNLEKIRHHGKRADGIVKGMLEHSRTSTGEKTLTNINVLADEFLKLSYHGLRAKDKNFSAEMVTHFDETLPKMEIVQQDIGRVLLNLFNNAFYAVNQKKKMAGADYKPEVELTTFAPPSGGWGVSVKDNGNGIPDAIKDKIMQPFFTTKPTGEGTGLGLSLSYDIVVKGHGGSITVETKEGWFTEFGVILPIN